MYLKSITIKNFRKIKSAKCSFNPGLNLIIGPNDSGKTAVIDTIRIVLKQIVDDYFRINDEDFNEIDQPIEIELLFSFMYSKTWISDSAYFAEYLHFTPKNKPRLKIWYSVKSGENNTRFPNFKIGPTKDVAVEMDAKCKDNFKVVYLRPLRDAENELRAKQGSRISKIFNKHGDITSQKDVLIKILKDFKDKSESFFDSGAGIDIKTDITELLEKFDDQSYLRKDIKIGPTELSTDPKNENQNLLRFLERISLYYDNLKKPGLGTQNMIFIAAELLHLKKQAVPKILLIEEVEAHLHPQRQLKIIKALQEKSKDGIQMVLTTHSPNLASVVDVERLNVCFDGEFYSLAKKETELSKKNYTYLARFLDITKANLFFAQGVILVEGPTEQLLVPEFAKILGHDLTDIGVSVISTNNLGFDNFVNIFKRKNEPYNKIPVAVITDADRKNSTSLAQYKTRIDDTNNKVVCCIGRQLYSDDQLAREENIMSTFEKIIFKNTVLIKGLYIKAYNSIHPDHVDQSIEFISFYGKIKKEKAIIAQEVAQLLSEVQEPVKSELKAEIETNLEYIVSAIVHVIPVTSPLTSEE